MTKKIDFGSELDSAQAEAKAWKTIWSAGQGVTSIKDVKSISKLANKLKDEFLEALKKAGNFFMRVVSNVTPMDDRV